MLRGNLWEGEALDRFERAFADFIGVPQAVAVPSGRAGFRFIFQALDLPPGSEVICSAFGYPVVPHLIRSLGYDVRFVDCELETLGMDPDALARSISERTRVVVATHLFGVPCRIREIAEIAQSHGAVLVEDCAHCFGASVAGRRAGAYGSFASFSFETSKPINTMGGGMIATRDEDAAARLRGIAREESSKNLSWLGKRLLKTSFEAMVTHPLVFNLAVYPALRIMSRGDTATERFASGYQRDEVTLHGRMGRYTNYQAKLGLAQMEQARHLIARRTENAERMMERLRGGVRFQRNDGAEVQCNYMLLTALLPKMGEVAHELLRRGVDTKHHYMRDCSGLLDSEQSFPRAAQAEREVLHLPAYPELGADQIDAIAEKIMQAVTTVGPRPAAARDPISS